MGLEGAKRSGGGYKVIILGESHEKGDKFLREDLTHLHTMLLLFV